MMPMNVSKSSLVAAVLLGVLSGIVVACTGSSSTPTPSGIVLTTPVADPTATPGALVTSFDGVVQQFEVNLSINGSPQEGTAVFSRRGGISHVELHLSPGAPAQMVTIRRGECPLPEGFEESLELAIGGVLRQDIRQYTLDDLMAGGLTLVVSTDDDNFNSFAACADLPGMISASS